MPGKFGGQVVTIFHSKLSFATVLSVAFFSWAHPATASAPAPVKSSRLRMLTPAPISKGNKN
jgi:hypothetical protein